MEKQYQKSELLWWLKPSLLRFLRDLGITDHSEEELKNYRMEYEGIYGRSGTREKYK